jgi:hypothetical protein
VTVTLVVVMLLNCLVVKVRSQSGLIRAFLGFEHADIPTQSQYFGEAEVRSLALPHQSDTVIDVHHVVLRVYLQDLVGRFIRLQSPAAQSFPR